MLFISHRGNLDGPNPERENSPDYIDEAIAAGFTVEVDFEIRDDGTFILGRHYFYQVSAEWLADRVNNLLIHTKNREAVYELTSSRFFHYFCNEKDEFSLTSRGYILCWSPHPHRNIANKRFMIPLITPEDINQYAEIDAGAIISDYPFKCKEKFG